MARTWAQLLTVTEKLIVDAGGELWTEDNIHDELERAELLLTLHRAMAGTEKTVTLTTVVGQPHYAIHTIQTAAFSDFIWPLRATLSNLPLNRTSFAAITRLNSTWYRATGTPESFYMVGANLFGLHPTPDSIASVPLTYMAVPGQGEATSANPAINDEWQDFLPLYAAGVLLAAEGKIEDAQTYMQQFMEMVGLPRDERLMRGAQQKTEDSAEFGPHEVQD